MKDRLITIGLVAAGVLAGFLMRGPVNQPITGKINGNHLAFWVNQNCEIKQRGIDRETLGKGETPLYIHCE